MHHESSVSKRYYLELERPPQPRPRWWRDVWLIRDAWSGGRAILTKMMHKASAEHYVRCLNGDAAPQSCRNVGPESHAERWAMAS